MNPRRLSERVLSRFRDHDPRVAAAFAPALVLAAILFTRSPASNYIFDEQEALLANPFVNARVPFKDILTRDFWGLPHDRSIGSYRPLPNLVWRLFYQAHPLLQQPWALHFVNIVVHALNAACVGHIAFSLTRSRKMAWFSGAAFCASAVLTEAVTGVVGIADVLGALGILLAVLSLTLPLFQMGPVVFLSVTLGLFSKESTLVAVPLVAWTALVTARLYHPERPLRLVRAFVAFVASLAALALYTETRRRFFPTDLPAELARALPPGTPWPRTAFHAFLRWFAQPKLPQDPINNPLLDADFPHRVAGALAVYAGGISQLLFPWTLSGDYSFASQIAPETLFGPKTVVGGLLLVVPPLAGVAAFVHAARTEQEDRPPPLSLVFAIALVWIPVAYFPHSNIPVTLPTVRAERFLYVPAIGMALLTGLALGKLVTRRAFFGVRDAGPMLAGLFLGFQMTRARLHALDYTDDLAFWRATARAVPMSAKAHLNYGVMLGARSHLDQRLVENRRAVEIAPRWPMAHVYYADTLCRLNRADEAWPSYRSGMTLGPNDRNLIALSLQCLWDHGGIEPRREELLAMSDAAPGTWLAYLVRDIVVNGQKNGGVERKYRPRGYDEGPAE
ncbi:MAG TPA: tetratricopeptide repeat protein [Polyangiaceae bacterium]|nr:tetratricopeptide repeat protein [Polyangiaceae bacterium]